jgi:hypothetical protein
MIFVFVSFLVFSCKHARPRNQTPPVDQQAKEKLLDQLAVDEAHNKLNIKDINGATLTTNLVTTNLILDTNGDNSTTIEWNSDKPNFISDSGEYHRLIDPAILSVTVTLTAKISKGQATPKEKVFHLTVKNSETSSIVNALEFFYEPSLFFYEPSLSNKVNLQKIIPRSRIALPAKTADNNVQIENWRSSNSQLITIKLGIGTVSHLSLREGEKNLQLTADFIHGSERFSHTFPIVVNPLTETLLNDMRRRQNRYDRCYIPGADDYLDSGRLREDLSDIILLRTGQGRDQNYNDNPFIEAIMENCLTQYGKSIYVPHDSTITKEANDLKEVLFDNIRGYHETQLGSATIRRTHYLKDYIAWFFSNPDHSIAVRFENEAGVDAGGLRKDLFSHLGAVLKGEEIRGFAPFKKTSDAIDLYRISTRSEFPGNDPSNYNECLIRDINFVSEAQRESTCYNNLGKVFARALIIEKMTKHNPFGGQDLLVNRGIPLPIKLSSYLLARLLGENFSAGSLEEQYKKYVSVGLLDLGISYAGFTQSLGASRLGSKTTWLDSKPITPEDYLENMENVSANIENYEDDIHNMPFPQFRYTYAIESLKQQFNLVHRAENGFNNPPSDDDGIGARIGFFKEGFHTVIPEQTLRNFMRTNNLSTTGLTTLMAGADMSLDQLLTELRSTRFETDWGVSQELKDWFIQAVEELGHEHAAQNFVGKLLLFWTGYQGLPTDIAQYPLKLSPAYGPPSNPIRLNNTFLPVSHTCFNKLDLPEYNSKDSLKSKLYQAVMEAGTTENI